MPSLARVAVLGTTPATNPYSSPFVEDLRLAAARAGLRLEPVLISDPDELESAFAKMARAGAHEVVARREVARPPRLRPRHPKGRRQADPGPIPARACAGRPGARRIDEVAAEVPPR